MLANITGDRLVDALFAFAQDLAMDPTKLEYLRLRRHVFLARFARQPLLQWEHVDGRLIRRYTEILAEMLKEESAAAVQSVASQLPTHNDL